MTTRNSTRRSAGSSLSPDSFDDLFRRLLLAISHVRLVAQHFCDLSSLDHEDAPAGLTLYEAAQDLDALYSELDTWYVQHEHEPKDIKERSTSVPANETSP